MMESCLLVRSKGQQLLSVTARFPPDTSGDLLPRLEFSIDVSAKGLYR
jgi:hypothetical protein